MIRYEVLGASWSTIHGNATLLRRPLYQAPESVRAIKLGLPINVQSHRIARNLSHSPTVVLDDSRLYPKES